MLADLYINYAFLVLSWLLDIILFDINNEP